MKKLQRLLKKEKYAQLNYANELIAKLTKKIKKSTGLKNNNINMKTAGSRNQYLHLHVIDGNLWITAQHNLGENLVSFYGFKSNFKNSKRTMLQEALVSIKFEIED